MKFDFEQFKGQIKKNLQRGRWVYRGHSSGAWRLESTFQRFVTTAGLPFSLATFERLLNEFVSIGSSYLGQELSTLTIAQQIALAQHHGLPTPFLDWTESPYIACYFALRQRITVPSEGPIRIWALHTSGLPEWDPQCRELPPQLLLVRTRLLQSKRLFRQHGLFTFHGFAGDLQAHVDDERPQKTKLAQYDIDVAAIEVLEELRLMGISGVNLFDSIDGIASDVMGTVLNRLSGE